LFFLFQSSLSLYLRLILLLSSKSDMFYIGVSKA